MPIQTAAMCKILVTTVPRMPESMDASEQNPTVFGSYNFDMREEAMETALEQRISAAAICLPYVPPVALEPK